MHLMVTLWLVLLSLTGSRSQNASFIYLVEPKNTAVVQGELAIFNCSFYTNRTGEVLYWRKYEGADDNTGSNILYVEEDWPATIVDTNYTVVDDMNLGIPNATSSYAVAPDGDYILYVCWLVQEDSIQRQAHLIVLDSETKCGDNVTQGYAEVQVTPDVNQTSITLMCSVSYIGFYAPSLAWYDENHILIHNITNVTDTGLVTSSLTIDDLENVVSGTPVTCRTYFDDPPEIIDPDPGDTRTYDQSAPEYQSDCIIRLGPEHTTAEIQTTSITEVTSAKRTSDMTIISSDVITTEMTSVPTSEISTSFTPAQRSSQYSTLVSLFTEMTTAYETTVEWTSSEIAEVATTTAQLTSGETTEIVTSLLQTTGETTYLATTGLQISTDETTELATSHVLLTSDDTTEIATTTVQSTSDGSTEIATANEQPTSGESTELATTSEQLTTSKTTELATTGVYLTTAETAEMATSKVRPPTDITSTALGETTSPAKMTSDVIRSTTYEEPRDEYSTSRYTTSSSAISIASRGHHSSTSASRTSTFTPPSRASMDTAISSGQTRTTLGLSTRFTDLNTRHTRPQHTDFAVTDATEIVSDDNVTWPIPDESITASSGMPWWALLILLIILFILIGVITALLVCSEKYRPLLLIFDQKQLMTSAFSQENVYEEESRSHAGTVVSSLDGMEGVREKVSPGVSPDDITVGMYVHPTDGQTTDGHTNDDKNRRASSMFWSSIVYIENWIRPKRGKRKKPAALSGDRDAETQGHSEEVVIELNDVPNGGVKASSVILDRRQSSELTAEEGDDTETERHTEQDSGSVLKENEEMDLSPEFTLDL